MKKVLCFGDSNTYGYNPDNGSRYSKNVRWTGVLQNLLKKEDVQIVEEGLVGRTTVFEDSNRPGRKGIDYLVPLLERHKPIDALVLMLGTNDCKAIYHASALVIGQGMERLIKDAKRYQPDLRILLVSPIHLGDAVWKGEYDPEFNRESVQVSRELKEIYQGIAREYDCDFLAASDVATPSVVDLEHLNEQGHLSLAKAIYEILIEKKRG